MAEPHTSSGDSQKNRGGLANWVKDSATAQLTNQKDRGTDALGRVAAAVRSSTQKLREEQHDTMAGYADKAANHLENWSRHLREKGVDELLSDVQRLARRQPAVFIGSAFALGLVGARFLKSSRQQNEYRYDNESPRTRYGGSMSPSTVHDYSGVDRDYGIGISSASAVTEVENELPGASTGSSAEGTARSNRGRRTTLRTEQS